LGFKTHTMPIEIKELHIKASVQDTVPTTESTNAVTAPETRLDEIVATCVEQVLNILKEKQER
jgi:hypothetical protein